MPNADGVTVRWSVQSGGDVFHHTSELAPDLDGLWHRDYATAIEAGESTSKITVTVSLPPGEAWILAADRKLAPLSGAVIVSHPVGAFVVTRGAEFWRWGFPPAIPRRYRIEGGRATVTLDLYSREACGVTAWGDSKLAAPPSLKQVRLSADRLTDLSECIWFEPFPDGARAALCLTDHADYDSTEMLKLLSPLIARAGLRFTKSIFPHGDPHKTRADKTEPGLDDPAFRKEIARLHEMGVEIAYHGFSPRVRAPDLRECDRRAELMKPFSPETWIDHGSGDYLFSRQARLGGVSLVSYLEGLGIRNYWSYFDSWDNPLADLSCWRDRSAGRFAEEGRALSSRIGEMPAAARNISPSIWPPICSALIRTPKYSRGVGTALFRPAKAFANGVDRAGDLWIRRRRPADRRVGKVDLRHHPLESSGDSNFARVTR